MSVTQSEAISCQELVELVTDYLEGALDAADLARFEEHVSACVDCRRYLEQLRQTIRVTGTLRPDDLSLDAEAALLQAFRGWRDAS
jgi:predicted anti-sigma-YlaC factor YlaD